MIGDDNIKKGYTLLEIICSISLILIIFIVIMNIYSHIMIVSNKTKKHAISSMEQDNLQLYLENELENDNVKILSISNKDYFVEYEKTFVEKYGSEKKYLIQNKRLKHDKYNNSVKIQTKNTYYKKQKDNYTPISNTKIGNNILIENVKDVNTYEQDNNIIMEFTFLDDVENKIICKIHKQ